MHNVKKTKVVIAGGGTSGWMAAAAFSKLISSIDVVLIESADIPTIGVGEATIPTLIFYLQLLKINEAEFMRETQASFKLGINFENWRKEGEEYFHGFGMTGRDCWAAGFQHFWRRGRDLGISAEFGDYCLECVTAKHGKFTHLPKNGLNYAYHIDAGLFAKYLRKISEEHGCQRIEGTIEDINLCDNTGNISSLRLNSGELVDGDLFIDCTGQRALLIEGALQTKFKDWGHWLLNNSAIAVQTESVAELLPYTRSTAFHAGWQWRIPLQSRVGNGIVYSDDHISDDEAQNRILSHINGKTITQPRVIKFKTGTREKHWNKNCIAVGLSSGFLEPLESTSIHLVQDSILRLLRIFPQGEIRQADIDEFNEQTERNIEKIRDFIILHYAVTNRSDKGYWGYCKNMPLPDSLAHRITMFKETGRVFRPFNELFDDSWMQVMIGQGLIPDTYHPIVDNMSEIELTNFLKTIRETEHRRVSSFPSHRQYLAHFCHQNSAVPKQANAG